MKQYRYMRLYHHNIGDLNDIMENVAYMSSPLIRANKHSEVLASDRNCGRNKARQHDFDVHSTHSVYKDSVRIHTLTKPSAVKVKDHLLF